MGNGKNQKQITNNKQPTMSKKSTGAFIGGMLLGSTIGTIIGILIAPRTGKETRQFLKKSADTLPELAADLSTTVQLQTDRISGSALRRWDATLNRLRDAIAAGIEASIEENEELTESQPDLVTDSHSSVSESQL